MLAYPGQTHQEAQWHQRWPGVTPNMLHTGAGAPCGIIVYEGDLFGEKYRGALIHADAGAVVGEARRLARNQITVLCAPAPVKIRGFQLRNPPNENRDALTHVRRPLVGNSGHFAENPRPRGRPRLRHRGCLPADPAPSRPSLFPIRTQGTYEAESIASRGGVCRCGGAASLCTDVRHVGVTRQRQRLARRACQERGLQRMSRQRRSQYATSHR